ncbi:MAG: hypothetical protein R6V03_10770 [Kiritimatiellia bacterium]
MREKKYLISAGILTLAILLTGFQAEAGEGLTLGEALRISLANNPSMQIKQREIDFYTGIHRSSKGKFDWQLKTSLNSFQPDLTSPVRFRYISTVKAPLQTGFSGRVPVPPEKRFLINYYGLIFRKGGALCRQTEICSWGWT